jgi:catechol 2,3-dioxygenase-like lactoylglutathione lyase family enzyme
MPVKYDGYMMVLFVKDLDRARDFYQNVMGLESERADDNSVFQLGPDGLMLIEHATADDLLSPEDVDHEAARGARSVIATGVEDVDAAYEELRSKGVEFIRTPETRSWGMRCAHFKDPDGNVWEINKWLGGQ